jgi:hypothetical protein
VFFLALALDQVAALILRELFMSLLGEYTIPRAMDLREKVMAHPRLDLHPCFF